MSIERNSDGLPHIDPHKRTTKVNFSIVIGIAVFFISMFAIVWWFATTR